MKKKTKIWIICGSIFGTAAVATAVAVPCALLLKKDNRIVLDSDRVYIEDDEWCADGTNEKNFIHNYIYKDLNTWLSQQDKNLNLTYKYGQNNGKVIRNLNEFRFTYEPYANEIDENDRKDFININNVEKLNYNDVYCEKFEEINKKVGYQAFDDIHTGIYKIETNMIIPNLTYNFTTIIDNNTKSVSAENYNSLDVGKTFTYYYVVHGNDTPWWEK